jgi:Putative beta-barrel porin 2
MSHASLGGLLRQAVALASFIALTAAPVWAQQSPPSGPSAPAAGPQFLFGGAGWMWLSGFTNPALLGALYSTPLFPLTGYYALYPGTLIRPLPGDHPKIGPVRIHPFVGFAEMYTDNVFRVNARKQSDVFHTAAPGIQAQLPFGREHLVMLDYRTNLQFYERTPSNNVDDQTAAGSLNLHFPGGLRVDLQGEHKVGHDPRGSAVDTQALEVNKWVTDTFTGQTQLAGSRTIVVLTTQALRWRYLNNDQDLIRDRLVGTASLTVFRRVLPKTFALVNVGVVKTVYDHNKNVDGTLYTMSGGAKWNLTEKMSGELQVGYQYLRFDHAERRESDPRLSRFNREQDSFSNLYLSGHLNWKPTSRSHIVLQPYRATIQDVVGAAVFFTATGANLSVSHHMLERLQLTSNIGVEHDSFSQATINGVVINDPTRRDIVTTVGAGLNYRTVRWLGLGLQYTFEHRDSTQSMFSYEANTVMVAVQAAL